MSAVGLVLVWCGAGVLGLAGAEVGPGKGTAGVVDWLFAALLGPFSFLIAFLAGATLRDGEDEVGDVLKPLEPQSPRDLHAQSQPNARKDQWVRRSR